MSIKIEKLTRMYGEQVAVNGISFEVGKGEVAGFIGPNGAGKSTTMKIITGFLTPTEGKVWVSGFDVSEHPMEVKKRIGYLPENNPLYPEMYIREYLGFVRDLYGLGRKNGNLVEKVVEITGLGPEVHKRIGELSRGYRQRVGLAQAILHDPEVLILDEPTSGLDPGQIVEIRNLISSLGKEKTVILSTHIMQEVEAICDRVILIDRGVIKADGTPAEISVIKPGSILTVQIEFDRDTDSTEIRKLEGVLRLKELGENRLLIESRSDTDLRPVLFKWAVDHGLTVLSMQKKEKTLEEVFRELTS